MPKRIERSNRLRAAKSRRRPSARHKKLSVSIIGAGRAGTALGRALSQIGCQIEVVIARHQATARRAARAIGKDTLSLTVRQLLKQGLKQYDRIDRSRLILIAVPDDAIAPFAEQLAGLFRIRARQSPKAKKSTRIALHVSGALSSEALAPLRAAGFAIGSIHPLVSISDPMSAAEAFRGTFFCVEGDQQAIRLAKSIVSDLGAKSFAIDSKSKALYHAAAVTASGHVTALFDIALEMLARCGLSREQAQKILLPLLKSTVANLSTDNPSQVLTGTFARGDLITVERHIRAMQSESLREALAAYVLLGRRSLSLAKERGPNSRFNQIARILSKTGSASNP